MAYLGTKPANQVIDSTLIADGTITTSDLATGVAGTGAAFFARLGTSQALSFSTDTKVALNTELFDTNSNFDTTNYRFTPTVAGYYQISAAVRGTGSTTNTGIVLTVFKNGSPFTSSASQITTTTQFVNHAVLVYLNGSTDYIELYVSIAGTGAASIQPTNANGSFQTWMSGAMVRAA